MADQIVDQSIFGFTGTHVLSDITNVDPLLIAENGVILDALRRGVDASGATLCGLQLEEFQPVGMTAVLVLSESHVSVHTYPEQQAIFVDAFTCGTRCRPELILETLLETLGPCEHRTSVIHRGAATPLGTLRETGRWRRSARSDPQPA
ncbi:S-adenosylmethionine decarboxylase [Actinomadura pelletieri DSM 43383]|uniref:S-adenosylmethionine decarboxylase n=1 Tax=Actinomadura pelletieri DSM 43383 TaxID=1120940 RepID=A0A495Q9U9_9ACTN|nr:adenosylmethionine decarboxylase [Actinomadura pelletieri]RKS68232.1 S-adenosylmethionine decarboxylase [Actinomadura pelletieri DSM 43383]